MLGHMGRSLIAACGAVMLLALIVLGSADAHTGTTICKSAKGKTLLTGPSGRIYAPPQKPVSMPGETIINACLNSMAHPVRLSPRSTERTETEKAHYEYTTGPFQLQGPWVAGVGHTRHGIDTSQVAIKAVNLKTGAVKQCTGWANVGHPGGKVTAIALKSNGSTAWAMVPGFRPPHVNTVAACESEGRRVLDEGEGIDLESLALNGSTVTWTDSGEMRSATLN
jgi:hypothetical protein